MDEAAARLEARIDRSRWSWPRFRRALAFLYLPQLLPLAVGPLTECSHCVATFWKFFVIVPGASMALMVRSGDAITLVAMALVTLGWLTLLYIVLKHRTAARLAIASSISVLLAVNALAFAAALRM